MRAHIFEQLCTHLLNEVQGRHAGVLLATSCQPAVSGRGDHMLAPSYSTPRNCVRLVTGAGGGIEPVLNLNIVRSFLLLGDQIKQIIVLTYK